MNLQQTDDAIEEVQDVLDIGDMLFLCGHRALGLTVREALEIDSNYHYKLEREDRGE